MYNGSGGIIYALHRYRLLIRQEEQQELAAGVDKEDLLTNLFPDERIDEALADNIYKVKRKDKTGERRVDKYASFLASEKVGTATI
jgi:hypothetical protein